MFSFNEKNSILGHRKLISDLCYYDPTGSYILSCSADTDIRLWSSTKSNCLTIYRSHLSPIWCLAAHSKTDRFASGSLDQTVRLWTPERLDILRTLSSHTDEINTIDFHPKGKYLASGSNDGLIILWALEQAQPDRIFKTNSPVDRLKFTSDANFLIAINHTLENKLDSISIWDLRNVTERKLIENIPSDRRLLKICQIGDGNDFFTGFSQTILGFNIQTSQTIRTDFSHLNFSRLIHLSSNESTNLIAIVE
mgnify:FL=1